MRLGLINFQLIVAAPIGSGSVQMEPVYVSYASFVSCGGCGGGNLVHTNKKTRGQRVAKHRLMGEMNIHACFEPCRHRVETFYQKS